MTASSTAHKGPLSAVPFVVLVRASLLKKERKKTDTPNEGWDEDRVPTCTSRILEGRSGGQVGLSCS